jgi:cytidylate kinase
MKIVTVSRQVGSYGDAIAELVAKKLGLTFIGREGIHELAMTCDPEYSDLCTDYETEHGPGFFERLFFDRPAHASLFEALTFEQAAQGNVVIVGRGSQHVLRQIPSVFSACIAAPFEIRVRRIMERSGISLDEARDFVRRHDRERSSLMQAVFGVDAQDWEEFDVILNTAHYAPEGAADVIASAVRAKVAVEDRNSLQDRLRFLAMAKRIETLVRRKMSSAVARRVNIDADPAGKIIIAGRVPERRDRERIGQLVSQQPGVRAVDNQLKVTELTF